MPASLQREIAWLVSGGFVKNYKEAASQSFKQGEPVAFDASGNIVALQASGSEHLNDTATKLLGFALRDASGTASTRNDMPVHVATDDMIIRLPIWAASSTNAEFQDIGAYGTPYALRNVSSIPCANLGTSTKGTLIYLQQDKDWSATDTYVSLQFRFDPASLIFKS